MKYDIFISYRREGGKEIARPLKSELERRGYRVFLDFDELKDGKFDHRIMDAIDGSPIFMMILSPHALDRCINKSDWVRKEIEYAIEKSRHIVPINPDRTFSNFPEDIPLHLKTRLEQHQFSEIMLGQLFKASIDKMVEERVKPVLQQLGHTPVPKEGDTFLKIRTDVDCRVFVDDEEKMIATAGKINRLPLRGGSYMLKFVSTTCDAAFIEEDTFRIQPHTEELYKVILLPIQEEEEAKEWNQYRLQLPDKEIITFPNEFGKYGFKEIKTDREIIPCIYDGIGYFSEGLAPVKKKGKWGFIDKTGKMIIPCIYDYACHFSEGLAQIEKEGKWGFIDKAGQMVSPCIYDKTYHFFEGLAAVKKRGKWGFIDKAGQMASPCIYDDAWSFSDGLAKVYKEGKCGFIGKTGQITIPCIYDNAHSFSDGLAKVYKEGKCSFIDKTGKEM